MTEVISSNETLITNPGIADRLEKDVVAFHQFGFSFDRCSDPPGRGVLRSSLAPISGQAHGSIGDDARLPEHHLWVGVRSPTLVPTVGPFLRTLVRITDGVDPRILRVVVSFAWSERNEIVEDDDGTTVAAKIAHHVHMLVRNSMGAALFLTWLQILLPNNVSNEHVQKEMKRNEDVNYPTVHLVDRNEFHAIDDFDTISNPQVTEGRPTPPVSVQEYMVPKSGNLSARIIVSTRMCTVRLTPVMYHLARAIRGENSLLQSNDAMEHTCTQTPLPLLLACVDKVANLFRIIMLARDYKAQHKVVLVVRNERIRAKLAAETKKFITGLDAADDCGDGSPRVETIDDTARILGTECSGHIVAVDLHHDALTLDDECNNGELSALSLLRSSEACIWGFEKDGIPASLDSLASRYVEVRCRSSLNLVAAMSVVMHRGWSDSVEVQCV